MKKFGNLLLFVLTMSMAGLLFTSCSKDDDSDELQAGATQTDNFLGIRANNTSASDDSECFTIGYPITVIYPDGSKLVVNSDEELETAIDEWEEDNYNSMEYPTLDFPVTVTFPDGSTQTVNTDEEICDLYHACYGDDDDYDDDDWDDDDDDYDYDDFEIDELLECFAVVYPIELTFPDNSTVSVNSDEELYTSIEDWYTSNPDAEEYPDPTYPFDIMLEDGSTQTIANEEEFYAQIEECD